MGGNCGVADVSGDQPDILADDPDGMVMATVVPRPEIPQHSRAQSPPRWAEVLAALTLVVLADLTIYVIDVAAGDKIPRKGGPGITRSDLLVINKIDLAPLVGASLDVMDRDARRMRG